MARKNKEHKWESVKVILMGKEITGIKSVNVEETGLEVDKTLGLIPTIKITDAETGKEIK